MRVFAIDDIHLPGGPRAKSMDRFGAVWHDHVARVRANWEDVARDDDVLLIVGDLSWAMTIDEAAEDLAWIRALRGTKIVIKGNHDFWWSGIGKVRAALGASVHALQYSHVVIGNVAFVGTRGWQCPGSIGSADATMQPGQPGENKDAGTFAYTEQDRKIHESEVGRLQLALAGLARSGEKFEKLVVMLHYPPMNPEHDPSGFTAAIDAAKADVCVHGHLHSPEWIKTAFEGVRGTARYHCVSADAVEMRPRLILEA